MRVFGHPLHPMLIHFPLAFWTLATGCDALGLAGVPATWPLAWLALVLGTGAAALAAVAGLIDFARVAERAAPTAMVHMGLMGCAFLAYAGALLTRTQGWGPVPSPGTIALACSFIGFALMVVGGHFGASLVYRFGVGREEEMR